MKCLTVTVPNEDRPTTVEVHLLNPRECFPNFGGSSQGIVATKTASLITRSNSIMREDVERNIYDPNFWAWIAKLINGEIKDANAVATTKEQQTEIKKAEIKKAA